MDDFYNAATVGNVSTLYTSHHGDIRMDDIYNAARYSFYLHTKHHGDIKMDDSYNAAK
jgi:hypothetical protein